MPLSGKQTQQFSQVLRKAYSYQSLERMLRFKLDRNLQDLSLADDFQQVVFDVIMEAEREWWTFDLLRAAREMVPNNGQLLAFAQQFGMAPQNTPSRSGLEALIRDTNSFLDIAKWREALGKLESQVCRVELNGQHAGTGFLMGSNVVMTNYHVVDKVINQKIDSAKVTVRFDYKRVATGDEDNPEVTNAGIEYMLAEDWHIDSSPYSQVDLQPIPKEGLPNPDQLDYALLRVAGSPGNAPIGTSEPAADPSIPTRGWLEPAEEHDFEEKSPLFIVQHPKGEPLKLQLDTDAILGLNENQTRVFYKTNTQPGSSGSPCFDQNWRLVALHHSGDPNSQMPPAWNEGIPFGPIMDLLRQRGVDQFLGEGGDEGEL